jgi:hypothetical protein
MVEVNVRCRFQGCDLRDPDFLNIADCHFATCVIYDVW